MIKLIRKPEIKKFIPSNSVKVVEKKFSFDDYKYLGDFYNELLGG